MRSRARGRPEATDVDLTPNQRQALANLARKAAGEAVDWINISDARALTELGLAERSREGWKITDLGAQALVEPET